MAEGGSRGPRENIQLNVSDRPELLQLCRIIVFPIHLHFFRQQVPPEQALGSVWLSVRPFYTPCLYRQAIWIIANRAGLFQVSH